MKPKIVVVAPRGKMGKLIIKSAVEKKFPIAGALGRPGADYIGMDAGEAAQLGVRTGAIVSDSIEKIIDDCDVIIDFSTVELSMEVLDAAVKHNKALVCGTTGFSKEQVEKIHKAATKIPLLYAANTSKAVNLMNKILALVAKTLGEEAQIDIIEMHDKLKLDAPSGTSKEMAHHMAEAMGLDFDESAKYGRAGRGIRGENEITFHSIRSGDISSSHKVIFGLQGERLEISHHAHNWECFANGAVDCAEFLYGKSAGLYRVEDVIKI